MFVKNITDILSCANYLRTNWLKAQFGDQPLKKEKRPKKVSLDFIFIYWVDNRTIKRSCSMAGLENPSHSLKPIAAPPQHSYYFYRRNTKMFFKNISENLLISCNSGWSGICGRNFRTDSDSIPRWHKIPSIGV